MGMVGDMTAKSSRSVVGRLAGRVGSVAVWGVVAVFAAAAPSAAGQGIRTVLEGEQAIEVRTQVRHTTTVVLPLTETIVDVVSGDADYWDVSAAGHVAYINGLFAGGGEILRLARTASRSSGFRMRGNLLALLPQLAMITASGRRRCCSTHLRDARSAPATSGSRGRAATATSERRCCRLPPPLMPTAACRLRPVRTTGSPSAGSLWTRACAG